MQFVMNQSQKFTQKLSAQLIQHLDILQFSSFELEQHIYAKGNENPFLTVEEPKAHKNYVDIMQFTTLHRTKGTSSSPDKQFDWIQTKIKQQEHYEKRLIEQIPIQTTTKDMKILLFLIRSLDERLFLTIDLPTVAALFETTMAEIEKNVLTLQSFEPIGIGARDYKEYFLLQISQDKAAPKLAAPFILDELELVSTCAIKPLAKKYKACAEEVKRTIRYIKKLKPIQTVDYFEPTAYIMPDIEVRQYSKEWHIQLNRHYLPSVSVNEMYIELLREDINHQLYYKQSLKDALALIQGIELRDKTLYDLVHIFVEQQRAFFEKGLAALIPMRLKDIAADLNVHESTISRAIRGKYMKTPHGVYALQSLFVKGLVNTAGQVDSITFIKQRIKELIDNENKHTPLADQQITQILCDEGIQISRRTVAKYRESMNILSSFNRNYM